jgi:hypothetical protein
MKGDVIRRTKEVLLERGWCQNALEDAWGRVCLVGAFDVATSGDVRMGPHRWTEDVLDAYDAIAGRCAGPWNCWNNAPERTFEEVVALLDEVLLQAAPEPEPTAPEVASPERVPVTA